MKKKTLQFSTLLVSSTLLFSGCGSAKSSDAYETMAANETPAAESWGTAEFEEVTELAYADDAKSDTAVSASEAAQAENDLKNRKLIYTVSLSMDTKDLDTLRTELESSIDSYGGYIESSTLETPTYSSAHRFYSITARVPSEKLDHFLETAGTLGTVTNKNIETEDITLQYVDQKAYLDSLQVEYERVTKLLEKATDLDQILALESKMSDLRYQINSYESQLRTYDNLVEYSTVYFYVSEVTYEQDLSNTVGSRISNGFRDSLYSVCNFFIDLFVFLIANLPILILSGLGIVLLVILLKKWFKKRKEKKEA